jgi:hypothetical protein
MARKMFFVFKVKTAVQAAAIHPHKPADKISGATSEIRTVPGRILSIQTATKTAIIQGKMSALSRQRGFGLLLMTDVRLRSFHH